MTRFLAGIAAVAVVLVGWAAPASAHASLEGSSPTAGAVLAEPPGQIELTYDEPVEVSLGAVR
ncbi:MAG: copper resistance protein CopC, partial [Acidimicrobiales bacterium]|nr:copper resistance protein CopC [Acidimicrobiales bacterium]